MNWIDYGVLAIVGIGTLAGAAKGLIHSFFQFAGLIISIIASKKYYVFVSNFIINNTNIETAIHGFIGEKGVSKALSDGAFLEDLYLSLPSSKMFNDFTGYITTIIINCLTLLITFITIRICIALIETLLKEVFKLPVLSTINHSGGALLGLIGSILALILIFAILIPISLLERFVFLKEAIEASVLSKYFYSYNFILKWIIDNALNIGLS